MERKTNDYFPLFFVLAFILLLSAVGVWVSKDTSPMFVMRMLSAFFFLTFGLLKVPGWRKFAKGFSTYDPVASKFMPYAYLYPLIEIGIGFCYLRGVYMFHASVLSILILSITNVGVAKALSRKQSKDCACIGTLFKVPLSRLTIAENSLMILMALWMLIKLT